MATYQSSQLHLFWKLLKWYENQLTNLPGESKQTNKQTNKQTEQNITKQNKFVDASRLQQALS